MYINIYLYIYTGSWSFSPYMSGGKSIWPEMHAFSAAANLLALPTGNGGVLYHPRFFKNKIVFDKSFINATKTADDIMFRLSSLSNNVRVVQAGLISHPIIRYVNVLYTLDPSSLMFIVLFISKIIRIFFCFYFDGFLNYLYLYVYLSF